jgi:RimJ/RimL family protein N-acetyltransferase
VFLDGARLVLDFAFDVIGTRRLEARAAVANGRGNGALRKVGAVQEGLLRRSFLRNGQYHDQVLWGILAEDWRQQRQTLRLTTVTH